MTAVRVRGVLSALLTGIAALAVVVAVIAGYVRHVTVDEGQFSDRATVALRSPAVRSLVAEKVTDDLVLRHADQLLAARPLIESVVASAVSGPGFGGLFRAGVRDLHRAVFAHDQRTVTLTVADAGTVVASALDVLRPKLAGQLRAQSRVELLHDRIGSASVAAMRFTRHVLLAVWLAGLLALLTAVGAVALAADRRRAVAGLGVATGVAGVLLVVGWQLARTLICGQVADPQAHAAALAVWGAFLNDLRLEAWMLAGAGAIIAAAASSVLSPVSLEAPLRWLGRRLVALPVRPWAQALRAVALAAGGVACVLDPGAVLAALITLLGVSLIYGAAGSLLEMVNGPPQTGARTSAGGRVPGRRLAAGTVLVAVAVAAGLGALIGSGAMQAPAPAQAPCDGSRILCDRPLDEVALAATHNAMSAPLPGWYSPEQEAAIPQQLQAGIRGLLIDTHYATRLPDGRLRTDFNGEFGAKGADDISPRARQAAQRLRERLGFRGSGPRGIYLCHGFCELGATALAPVLAEIHDFLVANPDQVLVIINEDYVEPAQFVAAVDRAGLGAMAYRGPTSGRWPTLTQMIDSGQRVVFLAEHHAGGAPWYHLAYRSITEETPYTFKRAGDLTDPARQATSCRPNRGPRRGASLFLVNNWVGTDPAPLAANAAKVNAREPLLRRLRTCERVRHHIPNLVAVDFYREGDVLGAVAALNRVREDP